MNNQYLLALDGGSSSFRAIIFDTQGNQLFVEQEEWEHLSDPLYPGSMSFDFEKNWQLIKKCIQNIIRSNNIAPNDILGVASTTMREGFILYDKNGEELLGFANVDSRSTDESAFLKQSYPDLEKKLYDKTGESFALGALPRLLWIKNHEPKILKKATCFNMLNDWISYKLTGVLATEPSNASTSGLFNLQSKQWEFDELKQFDIHLNMVPVVESGTVLGNISLEASEATGLSTQTKVVMGGGDAQLGCIGIGVTAKNDSALLGGSFWQFNHNIDELVMDNDYQARINCHAIPTLWQYELIAWQVGFTIDWYIEAFFDSEIELLGNKQAVFKKINERITDIPPGSHGMLSIFSNTMNMIELKNAAPTFTNFQLDPVHFNRYTFYKSILESVALVVLQHKEKIESLSNSTIESIVFAGGASNNQVWCQIISDVLGISVKVPVIKEATAFGASILAGIGCGVYTAEDIQRLVKIEHTYEPNINNHVVYQKLLVKWQEVYKAQLNLSDQGVTTSMWKAPGL